MFQGKFAIITPALIAGEFVERVRFRGYCILIALWSLLVYTPLAHWVWGGGFLTSKAIDFAGGTVIHISAGCAGLVAALFLKARRGYPPNAMAPNNPVMTLIGTGLLWVGWFDIHGVAGIVAAIGLTFLLRNVPEHGFHTQLRYQVEGVVVSISYKGTCQTS